MARVPHKVYSATADTSCPVWASLICRIYRGAEIDDVPLLRAAHRKLTKKLKEEFVSVALLGGRQIAHEWLCAHGLHRFVLARVLEDDRYHLKPYGHYQELVCGTP